ncbi:MAG TPA: hypothetical protein PLZ74_00515 [Kiritimatiellia bacterium]|nr:hypothetical protein [Kiritimatiellia bacterium]
MRVRIRWVSFWVTLAFCGLMGVSAEAKSKEEPQKVSVLMKEANDLMSQAQSAYVDGDAPKAIELYRKALAEIVRVERENPNRVTSAEFAPVRFRKALCETEIDRILIEEINASSRTVAVSDTRALEEKRKARQEAAATNRVPEATIKLSVKRGVGGGDAVDHPEDKLADAVRSGSEPVAAKTDAPVTKSETGATAKLDVKKELSWVRELLSLEKWDEADQNLRTVLRHEPTSRDARFLMALVQMRRGRADDASVMMDDLLADPVTDESVCLLASAVYAATGSYGKAMAALDQAMRLNPQRPLGYLNMAWLLLEMRPADLAEPEMYYRQAVKLGGARDRDIERRLGIKSE